MSDTNKHSDQICALESRVVALEKGAAVSDMQQKTILDFVEETKGHIKKFAYSVTFSLLALMLWIAKTVVEKVGVGF